MEAESGSLGSRLSPWQKLQAYDVGITPEVATSRVRAASASSAAQTRLFETMLARDADLGNAFDQRILALAGARWRTELREDVSDAAARRVTQAIPDETFSQLVLEHAAKFRPMGYAILEIEWAADWSVLGLGTIPYAATDVQQGKIRIAVDNEWIDVEDEKVVDRLIVIRADNHDPAAAARLRRCVGLWVTKAYLARDWRKYLERFGDPWLIGHYPDTAQPDPTTGKAPQDTVADALDELKGHGIAALPENVKAELLADSRGDATQAFDKLWDRCNEGIYNAILGQRSTTQQGTNGARASDQVRLETLDDIIEADARIVADAFQKQLVAKVEAQRGGGKRLVQVVYTWEREASQTERVDVMVKASAAGIEFDHEAARQELGLEPPSPEQLAAKAQAAADLAARLAGAQPSPQDGGAKPAESTPPAKSTAASGHEDAEAFASKNTKSVRALDLLVQAGAEGMAQAIKGKLLPALRKAVRAEMTPADADLALRHVFKNAQIAPLAAVFERCIVTARANARVHASAQIDRLRKRSEHAK